MVFHAGSSFERQSGMPRCTLGLPSRDSLARQLARRGSLRETVRRAFRSWVAKFVASDQKLGSCYNGSFGQDHNGASFVTSHMCCYGKPSQLWGGSPASFNCSHAFVVCFFATNLARLVSLWERKPSHVGSFEAHCDDGLS